MVKNTMQDKKTNQRNQRGLAHGLWIYRWDNGKIANIYNYVDGQHFGYSAHLGAREEIIVALYYAR